ncbi:alpha-glucosidase [Anaeromicropila populeti]|uniref:Alpha-glucosidase n=2 Tax=Anaeromicropila populeti TaxID=37658 RepID=A0A1I6IYI9_9FIRM|nr:alpha-glucosidase [Anaeromicropila populeti]
MEDYLNMNKLSKYEKMNLNFQTGLPFFREEALFSDGTELFRSPSEPLPYEKVTIRFRTARGAVDKVYLVTSKERLTMEKTEADSYFDYYKAVIQLENEKVEYYFEVDFGDSTVFYNCVGVSNVEKKEYRFSIMPGFKTPDWAKGAVFYQIMTDRFCNGTISNDVLDNEYFYIGAPVKRITDWAKYPAAMGVREFYGGDIQGILKKLDYLQNLGVDVIYLNPVFVSPSNHKYDIQDYDYIDPHFGVIINDGGEVLRDGQMENKYASKYISRVTDRINLEASNKLFAEFVDEVHKRGMKVILDGVFNHCGSFNKWMDRERLYENQDGYEKGAYVSKDSPYCSFFKFYGEQWPYNGKYDGWWGHDTLPKLNYEDSNELLQYVMRIAKKWVAPPYNVDGWRLDVAADLGHSSEYNHEFWKKFRKAVKEANPDAIILAEHYGDPSSWLSGDQWDTVMNYDAFMEPLTWFLTGMEKHSDEFRADLYGKWDNFVGAMKHHMSKYNTQSLQTSMNELSNHDHSRFLTRTNQKVGRTASRGPELANEGVDKGVLREAVMVQMTWTGAPTIYYGDEAGLCGWTDPDNRRTYPWGKEDKELIRYHKELIRIRKDYSALKTGSTVFLTGQDHFMSFGRFDREDSFVIAINNRKDGITVSVPVWKIGVTDDVALVSMIRTNQTGFELRAEIFYVKNGTLELSLPPVSGIVLKDLEKYLN